MLIRRTLEACAALLSTLACGPEEPEPFVLFIGLDGASLDIVDDLRAEGRLPTFDRLIRTGISGPLQSWASKPIMSENLRRGFWSPIVWTSIATGKIPEKHGVRDFVLPIPGTSSVWMGADEDPASATMTIPELHGQAPLTLTMRMHSFGHAGAQRVQFLWNGEPVDTVRLEDAWQEIAVEVTSAPVRNTIELVFARQARAKDGRRLAAELSWLTVTDRAGAEIFHLDPALHRDHLGRGFYTPQAQLTEVQSLHWRAKPFWSLLGSAGVPVGIVGYWGTWPAYPVNGFLASSRMGIREQRRGSSRLSWPAALAEEMAPLAPDAVDLAPTFERLHLLECNPPFIEQQSVLKKILIQDEYYLRVARELPPEDGRRHLLDLSAVHRRRGAPDAPLAPRTANPRRMPRIGPRHHGRDVHADRSLAPGDPRSTPATRHRRDRFRSWDAAHRRRRPSRPFWLVHRQGGRLALQGNLPRLDRARRRADDPALAQRSRPARNGRESTCANLRERLARAKCAALRGH